MNKENFNDVVYQDTEMLFDQKIELLEMCRNDYDKKLRAVYKHFSLEQKAEMLHFITSAQLLFCINIKRIMNNKQKDLYSC